MTAQVRREVLCMRWSLLRLVAAAASVVTVVTVGGAGWKF
jgi:hypothetical protein